MERFIPIPVRGFDHVEVSDLGNLRVPGRDRGPGIWVLNGCRRCHICFSIRRYERSMDRSPPRTQGLNCEVAHLVLLAFRGYPNWPFAIRHLNGDLSDDRLENLEWVRRTGRSGPRFCLPLNTEPH